MDRYNKIAMRLWVHAKWQSCGPLVNPPDNPCIYGGLTTKNQNRPSSANNNRSSKFYNVSNFSDTCSVSCVLHPLERIFGGCFLNVCSLYCPYSSHWLQTWAQTQIESSSIDYLRTYVRTYVTGLAAAVTCRFLICKGYRIIYSAFTGNLGGGSNHR